MDKIAAFLIEKETITGKEFMKIFHEEKGIKEPETKQRIEEKVFICGKTGHSQPVSESGEESKENGLDQTEQK